MFYTLHGECCHGRGNDITDVWVMLTRICQHYIAMQGTSSLGPAVSVSVFARLSRACWVLFSYKPSTMTLIVDGQNVAIDIHRPPPFSPSSPVSVAHFCPLSLSMSRSIACCRLLMLALCYGHRHCRRHWWAGLRADLRDVTGDLLRFTARQSQWSVLSHICVIYIYIYICVCVCVCVRAFVCRTINSLQHWTRKFQSWNTYQLSRVIQICFIFAASQLFCKKKRVINSAAALSAVHLAYNKFRLCAFSKHRHTQHCI